MAIRRSIYQNGSMNNNDILKKLRIALELKEEDIIEILKLTDFELSKSELSALFRKEGHRNYKECGDQILRRFLDGLIIKNRGPRGSQPIKKHEAFKKVKVVVSKEQQIKKEGDEDSKNTSRNNKK